MTEETGRGRERKREGKGVFFLGGGGLHQASAISD